MPDKIIKVSIDKLGNTQVTTDGYTGSDCLEATKKLEQALTGSKGDVSREYKPEYYQESESKQNLELRY